jgi:TRAP-type C4-dicarboxylate transport system permease small subunit
MALLVLSDGVSTMNTLAQNIEEKIHTTSKALNWVACFAVVFLVMGVFVDVFARWINRPVPGNLDTAELLLIPAVFFAMAYTHKLDGHIRVEILYTRLSTRGKGIMDSITLFIATGVYGVMIWSMANRVWRIIASPDPGPITIGLAIPIFPLLIIIVVALIVLCLELLVNFSHAVARASGK